jgi:release factor glutamine methyltransferase
MLQNHATLKEIRSFLYQEIRRIYPEGETSSMVPLIMEYAGYPSTTCLSDPGLKPGPETIAHFNEIVAEIHTHRPIQYILGTTTFCNLNLCVNENVLIPRPETEEMVLRIIETLSKPPDRALDLGTGSGCIALALKHRFPGAHVYAMDISIPALEIAGANGVSNQLEVEWFQGDMKDTSSWIWDRPLDLIVSNPPYVLREEKIGMDRNVLDYEPSLALFVEDSDPLIFYHAIARLAMGSLSPEGTLWIEINERFGTDTALLMKAAGFNRTNIHKDIHDKERFIEARK